MKSLSLLELSEREAAWLEALTHEDADGNPISEEEQERIIEAYIDASDAFKSKADRYCDLIHAFAVRASYQEDCACRYAELARRNQSVADKLKWRVRVVMEMRSEVKVETDHHKITLVNNGGKKPLILDASKRPEDFPEAFHKRRIDLDKEALRAALEEGQEVAGAALGERGKHLRIV